MTGDGNPGRSFAREGHALRESNQFAAAGDQYTFVAYAGFADSEFTDMTKIGSATYWLLCAGLCYRLGDRMDRCRNRCRQGILIASDFRENTFEGDALRGLRGEADALAGLSHEYTGDFKILGGIESHDESYDRAADYYRQVDNHLAWNSEAEFDTPMQFVIQLAEYLDHPIKTEDEETITTSLLARLEFKRTSFLEILNEMDEVGHWKS